MGKKNLDKLFHEKLKNFSEVPDEKVWQSIETSLNEKKKSRKVIPIWWKLGGVAAVLLVAITLLNPFADESSNTPAISDVNDQNPKTSEEKKGTEIFENTSSEESQVVDSQQENASELQESTLNKISETQVTSREDSKANTDQPLVKNKAPKSDNILGTTLANSDKSTLQEEIIKGKASDNANIVNGVVSTSIKTKQGQIASEENLETKESPILNRMDDPTGEVIIENNKEDVPEAIADEAKKKSIFDEIAEQNAEEIADKSTGGKWSAGPSVAPVYYNAMGEGSPVHSIFVPNSKSGDVNLSYGLSVAYEVNKKLSIRSGLHKVDFGYRTNDIAFTSSLENSANAQIDNIDYTLTSKSLVVTSKATTGQVQALNQNPFLETSSDVSGTGTARDGVMEQQFGYLEVPVELNYALLDSKFGINLIGGISSLFLVDNSISLSSGELTTEVGAANNVNAVNFSTNVGFGLNYKFTPKVQLNIEPVFKYQLNTFSQTDGTFNPFSVGVYSGLSFKF